MRAILILIRVATVLAMLQCTSPPEAADVHYGSRLRTAAPQAEATLGRLQMLVIREGELPQAANQLRERGVHLLANLPGNAILVAAEEEVLTDLAFVEAAYPWTSEQAIAPELASMGTVQASAFSGGVPVVVWLAPDTDPASVADRLRAAGAETTWVADRSPSPQIGLLAHADRLDTVLRSIRSVSGLVWADVQPPIRLRNAESAWLCQSGRRRERTVFDHGLHGEGQVIGILDTGIDADMCFFADAEHGLPPVNDAHGTLVDLNERKILAVDFLWHQDWPEPGPTDWDDSGHGTHVAGSAAGDHATFGAHDGADGMAPAARLVIQDGGARVDDCADLPGLGCPLQPLEPVLAQAYAQGVRLHTNSWGDEENLRPLGRYTERTADVDRFAWNHKDFLVFFAAGNEGPSADSVGSPATGKNVVAVGATWHGDLDPPCVAAFSSRGWTHDGRIKPDIVVPGQWVESASSDYLVDTGNCGTHQLSGTSMASPTAAGLAALVRQYYAEGYYPQGTSRPRNRFEPSAALVKATLIASAVDLSRLGCASVEPIPSRDQGWGMVQLDRALHFAGSPDFRLVVVDDRDGFSSAAAEPSSKRVVVTGSAPLKIVLVWTDPPSTAAASSNLVNDLDLVVSGPLGRFVGNALSAGESVPWGEPDRRNNVEVVWLPEAAGGVWQVSVTPHVIASGPQDYALVITGAVTVHSTNVARRGVAN